LSLSKVASVPDLQSFEATIISAADTHLEGLKDQRITR